MEADDFDPILSQFGPMLTNPELQPGIDPGFVGDDVPEAESIAEFIMRLHGVCRPSISSIPEYLPPIDENLDQSSQRQQSRRQDTQLIRNQGTDFQLLRPISISLPNTQLQRHPRQPNSPVQNNILDNPNISTTSLNETVAHVVNKGNSTTGISTNSLVEQWSSISRLLPNTVVQGLQKSHQNLTRYEQALEQSRPQVMLVVSSRNVQQLQIIRETLAETRNKCQMERERWFQVLEIARTQQRDRLVDTFIGDIEELVNRATELCSEYKTFGHSVESLLHQLQLQQQQSPQNPMLNPGLGGDDGAGPQVPWNFPGAQNPSLNTRIPVQNQQMMNASQNRVGGNPPNHNLGGANLSTTSPQNLQVSPNHLDNRPPGPNMPPNTAKNRADLVKANFSKFLLTVNIDPVIHLAGRTIEMWDLYHAAREFDARFGRDNPAKFRMISYQLGLPSYGPEQVSIQAGALLQGHYNRLTAALEITASQAGSFRQQSAHPLMQTSQTYLAQLDPAISDKNIPPSTTAQVAASSINATLPRTSSSGMIGIEPIVSTNISSLDPVPEIEPPPSDSSPFEISGLVRKVRKRAAFEGSYSTVFVGEYRDTKVAIKEIRTVTTNRVTERKFHRELQTWWRLRHPNILPLLGYIHEDDTNEIYRALISPWMENKTAAEYIQRDLSPSQRLNLFGDVINGLQYLHNFQPVIVHADLKPYNVLITETGVGQICDFGLVRLLQEDMPTGLTTTTAHTGTTRYLAYELVRNMGKAVPTAATDIYALGCLGMEFVYRHPPHHDLGENTLGILKRIERGHHPANLPTDEAGELTLLGTLFNSCWAISSAARPDINDIHRWFWDNHSSILSGL